jgi:hypothetical protein
VGDAVGDAVADVVGDAVGKLAGVPVVVQPPKDMAPTVRRIAKRFMPRTIIREPMFDR